MKKLALLLSSVALLACDIPSLIDNAQFDSWCGDTPCGWDVDGKVARVGTWHSDDYAVELVSDDARIHQLREGSSVTGAGCIAFSMLAMISEDAHAYVELDFLDDGIVDWSERIPASDYEALSFSVNPPSWYESVRFILRKDGPGEVRIARLQATAEHEECFAREQVVLEDLPAGAPCEGSSECALGRCTAGRCGGCRVDSDCEGTDACGYADLGNGALGLMCIEQGTREIGNVCHGDAECTSGICCDDVCSTCCDDPEAECGDSDALCAPALVEAPADHAVLPHLCEPGGSRAESGAYCAHASDCMSGECELDECVDDCLQSVTGELCESFDSSCEDPEQDPLCCWFCGPETCLVTELPGGSCK
jgi:hypothetical protein